MEPLIGTRGANDLLWNVLIQGFPALIRLSVEASQARRMGYEGGDTMKSGEKKPGACAIWSRSLSIGDPMREGKREDKGKEQVPA